MTRSISSRNDVGQSQAKYRQLSGHAPVHRVDGPPLIEKNLLSSRSVWIPLGEHGYQRVNDESLPGGDFGDDLLDDLHRDDVRSAFRHAFGPRVG